MKKIIVDDEFLYEYVKKAGELMLERIPNENEIEHEFSKKFLHKMNKLIRQEKRSSFMKKVVIYSKRAAMIGLIMISVLFTITMSVEAYRIRFFDVVTDIWDEFASLIFKKDEGIKIDKLIPIESEYVPKGFKIFEREVSDYVQRIFYQDDTGKEIIYEQKMIINDSVIIDTEDVEIENMKILNQEISIIKNKGIYQVYWYDDMYIYVFMGDVEKQEFLSMAEDIIKKNKKK